MTYDQWKTTNRDDEFLGPEPPPCERPIRPGFAHLHPRFPSGDCVECGALCTQACKHPDAEAEASGISSLPVDFALAATVNLVLVIGSVVIAAMIFG